MLATPMNQTALACGRAPAALGRAARPALVLVALALASPAAAESLGVLAVAPPPGPGSELVEVVSQLRQVMRQKSPSLVLDARQLQERMSGPVPSASLAEIDRAFEGARSAAVGGDFEGSVRALRAVLEELEKLPDGEETFSRWTSAMLRLAKSEADLGRADAARGVLERLLRAAPTLKADPKLYPPRFAAQVDEVRAQLRALPQRRLQVTSATPGARVFVNGRDVGTAPVTVALAAGRYRVTGLAGKLAAPRQTVDLTSEDQSAQLDFALAEVLRPKQGPGLAVGGSDLAGRLVALGAYLGLDQLLAVGMVEEGGIAFATTSLYDVRRGMLKREARVRLLQYHLPPGGPSALADFLLTGEVTSPIVEVPGGVAAAAPSSAVAAAPVVVRGKDGGTFKPSRTLGWTAFGAGVAAVGLGGVSLWQGISAQSSYADAKAMLGPGGTLPTGTSPADYDKKLKDGDGAKRNAIITGVGAGACAVTAGILGYLAYKQTGEIGPFRF